MNRAIRRKHREPETAGQEIPRREFLVSSIAALGTTALAGMVAGCSPPPPPARNAIGITIGAATIAHMDCDGCFDGSVPVTVAWAAGAGNTAGVKITFDANTPQNIQGLKATSTLKDDVMYPANTKIGISGCLTDPCTDGSFVFTAATPSSVPITNATQTVTVPKLGFAVAGLKDTNGTSDDPHKPFVPIKITIKNCGAAPGNFNIAVNNEYNCEALGVAPAAIAVGAGAVSGPITISGKKTDGHTGGRFKVSITPPGGMRMQPCVHSVRVE